MNIRDKALNLRNMGLYEELFGLLATQPGGGAVLDELLKTDEALLDPYVDWITRIMSELSGDMFFAAFMSNTLKKESPGKYLLFHLLNRGMRSGGEIPVDDFRRLIVDVFGQGELDLIEVSNPGFLDGETVTVKECLKVGLRDKFMPIGIRGRA